MSVHVRRSALYAVMTAALLLTACASTTTPGSGPATPAESPRSPSPEPPTAITSGPPACDALAWRTAPLSVSHDLSLPPVPVVTAIRTGSHPGCRYDRIVFDLSGAVPGYDVRYITRVTADPSDRPVTVPGGGDTYLLIVLHPAQAHRDGGPPTLAATAAALGYPMMRGYAVVGDYEGYVSIAVGLDHTARIRVGEMPGRLYVDVAH